MRPERRIPGLTLAVLASFHAVLTFADAGALEMPDGASIMILQEDRWNLHAVIDGQLRQLDTESEARAPIMHGGADVLAYIGADGALHEVSLANGADSILLSPDASQTFAQPAYDRNAEGLYLVAFKGGSSADTDIVYWDRATERQRLVVRQRSSQFEPAPGPAGLLLYSSVHCTLGCGKIIQEVWQIDPRAEDARQLTLTNAIARQATATRDGFYFSSNRRGHFHIWRQSGVGGDAVQLTRGTVTDVNPSVDRAGTLYFIRHEPAGSRVLRFMGDGRLEDVSLPPGAEGLRDLRIDPFISATGR